MSGEIDFGNLLVVMTLAAAIPLLLGLVPQLPVPDSVVEILAGIIVGPAALGWVQSDEVIQVLSKLGVAFLLFLAGLEIDFRLLRGRPLRLAAEFGSIIALSMFFSRSGTPKPLETVLKLVVLAVAVAIIVFATTRGGSWRRKVDEVLFRLDNSSAQPRVRIGVLLLVALVVLADRLQFDAILGAFLAGAIIAALADPAREDELGHVRHKLEALGFGFFVPVFFVATGLTFPVTALFSNASALVRVPLFLLLLLLVRRLPALFLRDDISREDIIPAGLLQATSLSFIVVAAQVGVQLGEIRPINAASLIAAGMLSVLLFPAGALAILRRNAPEDVPDVVEPAGEE